MKVPKLAELKELPLIGFPIGDILDACGIEDGDLPDIVPDDIDYDDPEVVARYFPKLVAKATAAWGDWDKDQR